MGLIRKKTIKAQNVTEGMEILDRGRFYLVRHVEVSEGGGVNITFHNAAFELLCDPWVILVKR